MPAFAPIAGTEMLAFAALGLLAGLVAPAFLGVLRSTRRLFQASKLPLPLRLALGGLGVGAISVWVPQVWGNGYSVVNSLLHEHWVWSSVLLLLACKALATWLTCGSGAVGGIFTPTLFVGAAVGNLFALALQAVWPDAGALPAYVAVGMGATLAAAASAPLMAILMIFEMTLSYQLMLPLMLSCVIAYAVARATGGPSMYEITAQRAAQAEEHERLRTMRIAELIRPGETVLPAGAPLSAAAELFRRHTVKYIYLVDDADRYRGTVALHDIAPRFQDPGLDRQPCAELARQDALPLLTAGMSLDEALRQFMRHHGERLPIVRDLADPAFLGTVHKTDLLDAYVRLNRSLIHTRIEA
jgi:CIC family chloride channel protein